MNRDEQRVIAKIKRAAEMNHGCYLNIAEVQSVAYLFKPAEESDKIEWIRSNDTGQS